MSKIYTIDYDLTKPGQNYHGLIQALEALNAKRMLLSKWILLSDETAETLAKHLRQFMDNNDRLFVAELAGNWSGYNLLCNPNDMQNAAARMSYR